MKVLVTGGTGFAGAHTARALASAGHDLRLLVRDPAKIRTVFEPWSMVVDDVVVGDMTDADAVETALRGCDGVVHAAASVELSRAAARRVENANVRGVELVVGGAARRGLPSIVHVSSLGVFFVPGGPRLCPELPIAPGTTAYARSKATAEVYVRRLQEDGASIRISYPSSILGPEDPGPSTVTGGLLSLMRDGWLITSSGLQVIDVRDLAALHLTLLELPTGARRSHSRETRWSSRRDGLAPTSNEPPASWGCASVLLRTPCGTRWHGYIGRATSRRHRSAIWPGLRSGRESHCCSATSRT
jgi:dihydroflavonol-4-reductase